MCSFMYCRKYTLLLRSKKLNVSTLSNLSYTQLPSKNLQPCPLGLTAPPTYFEKEKENPGWQTFPPCSTSVCKPPCSPFITAWEKNLFKCFPPLTGTILVYRRNVHQATICTALSHCVLEFFLLVCSILSAILTVPVPTWVSCSRVVASLATIPHLHDTLFVGKDETLHPLYSSCRNKI